MPIDLSTQGIASPDDLGTDSPLPGRYHVILKAVDETCARSEAFIVDFEALNGTVPGQQGKEHREYFHVTQKAVDRLKRLALVTGLMKPNEQKQVSFMDAVGRQLIIELENDTYQGKTRRKVSYMGMWALDHPDVKDVPRDARMLSVHQPQQQAPAAAAPVAGGQGAAPVSAGAPVAAMTGGGGPADPYGDL